MITRSSKKGKAFVLSKEAIILTAYPDPGTGGEPWTIGGGHTTPAGGDKVYPGLKWTLAKALQVALQDGAKFDARVARGITRNRTQHVFDGFASWDFNTGAMFSGSVAKKWNAGDEAGALATLGLYVNAGGKRMQGLVTRRQQEIRIIRDNVWPDLRILVKDTYKSQGRYMSFEQLPWESPAAEVAFTPTPPIPQKKPEPPTSNVWLVLMEQLGKAIQWVTSNLR